MNRQIEAIVASISKWNVIKRDKAKVLSLWEECSSFKIVLPLKSNCKQKFHIYFGIEINNRTLSEVVVMHLISDYNDDVVRIKNFDNAADYIYSIGLNPVLGESAEITEIEAKARALAWENSKILKNYLEKKDAFDVFIVGKNDFLDNNQYKAYFGMKSNKSQEIVYSPDIIIHNTNPEFTTSYYDLARICPPYSGEGVFGLQELSTQNI